MEALEKNGVPQDRDVAESWEIADHGAEQSIVQNGPLAGRTLRSLMEEFRAELVGDEIYARHGDYFPLLLKFLDADKRLPAHLHPSDQTAEQLGLTKRGKTEAWYIIRADAGATAYMGTLPDFTPEKFTAALENGDAYDDVMNKIDTRNGETYFVPAGRVHALDGGNLAFGVMQNSDSIIAWDWREFADDGSVSAAEADQHRQWAVEQALYENGEQQTTKHITIQEGSTERTFCCACKFFVLEHLVISEKWTFSDEAPRFNTLTLISGAATLRGSGEEVFARRGESLLIPAGVETEITPNSLAGGGAVEILRCYVPDLEMDVVEFLRDRGIEDQDIAWLGSYGAGNDLLPILGLPQDTFLVSPQERAAAIERGKLSRDETS